MECGSPVNALPPAAPAPAADPELIEAARRAMGQAYAPYSGFSVGAALRLRDGSVMTGANFENASYGLSLCAETVAIAAASAAGRMADIVAVAVIGGPTGAAPDPAAAPLTPCGRCRQILAEAAQVAGRDLPVYCASAQGERQAVHRVSELLPFAFTAADLENGAAQQG